MHSPNALYSKVVTCLKLVITSALSFPSILATSIKVFVKMPMLALENVRLFHIDQNGADVLG